MKVAVMDALTACFVAGWMVASLVELTNKFITSN